MRLNRRLLAVIASCGFSLASTVLVAPAVSAEPAGQITAEPVLPSFDYHYEVSFSGLDIGGVELSLKPEGAPGCYRNATTTHPIALVRSLYGSPNETSLFCLVNGQIRSRHFESTLSSDSSQSVTLDFDWSKHQVTDNKGQVRTIPDDAVDNLALQQAVRLWLIAHLADASPPVAVMNMVDAKSITEYHLKLGPHETVTTPAGSFDTVTIERIDNPKRHSKFWLAPDRQLMPVKTETANDGRPSVSMVLVK